MHSTVEPGWYCSGGSNQTASVCRTICGDGYLAGDEVCDDGDTLPGGCNPTCTGIEPGFYCNGGTQTTPDICYTKCDDGIIDGEEECDPGDTFNPGCTTECKVQSGWYCSRETPLSLDSPSVETASKQAMSSATTATHTLEAATKTTQESMLDSPAVEAPNELLASALLYAAMDLSSGMSRVWTETPSASMVAP